MAPVGGVDKVTNFGEVECSCYAYDGRLGCFFYLCVSCSGDGVGIAQLDDEVEDVLAEGTVFDPAFGLREVLDRRSGLWNVSSALPSRVVDQGRCTVHCMTSWLVNMGISRAASLTRRVRSLRRLVRISWCGGSWRVALSVSAIDGLVACC